jgi:hypothetical protein
LPTRSRPSLFNFPLKYEMVLSNTYDQWFTAWPTRSKSTGIGTTPAEAFAIATGIALLDVMRLGARIIKRSAVNQQVRFPRDELIADGASEVVVDYLFANMALPLDAAGADVSMIHVICTEPDGSGSPIFPRDLHLIREAELDALIVVDCWLDTVEAGMSVRDPAAGAEGAAPARH